MRCHRCNYISTAAVLAISASICNVLLSLNHSLWISVAEDENNPSVVISHLHRNYGPQTLDRPVTFLWGIPTINSEQERTRRKLIRETYLSFYDLEEQGHSNFICSLNDIFQKRVSLGHQCRIAYTFFMGANANGPTELLFPNKSFPILVSNPNMSSTIQEEEDDIVYLNIRENQFDGKMPTWFKYASMVVEEMNVPFDYIAKIDSDTLVFTPATEIHRE